MRVAAKVLGMVGGAVMAAGLIAPVEVRACPPTQAGGGSTPDFVVRMSDLPSGVTGPVQISGLGRLVDSNGRVRVFQLGDSDPTKLHEGMGGVQFGGAWQFSAPINEEEVRKLLEQFGNTPDGASRGLTRWRWIGSNGAAQPPAPPSGGVLSSGVAPPDQVWLGIVSHAADKQLRAYFDIKSPGAIVVDRVMEDSPAAKAGLKDKDIIVKVDDEPDASQDSLQRVLKDKRPGDVLSLDVIRKGQRRHIDVTLGGRAGWGNFRIEEGGPPSGWLGIAFAPVDPQMMQQFDLAPDSATQVTKVMDQSPAAEAGLKANDVIVKIDDQDDASPETIIKTIGAHKPGDKVSLTVIRDGKRRKFEVMLGERPPEAGAPMGQLFIAPQWRAEMQPGRADELEKRIGELERRNDELEKRVDKLERAVKKLLGRADGRQGAQAAPHRPDKSAGPAAPSPESIGV